MNGAEPAVALTMAKPRFVFFRSVSALMLREMSTTFGRSPGGYVWAFAEPIAGIALMSIVFGLVTRTPAMGSNFPIFFASGFLPLQLYQTTSTNIAGAIRYSRPLLAYPCVSYVDAIVARFLLTALTQILITVILIGGIIVVYDLTLSIDYISGARALAMALALGVGVGMVNSYLSSMFPIWQFIWAVLNRPMFIISGVLFVIDFLPSKVRDLLLYNPMAHPIMMMRRGIYSTYEGTYISEVYVYLVALVLTALGMLLLNRHHATILDEGV